jgi:endoglucanase
MPDLLVAGGTPGVRTANFNLITAAEWAANVRMGWNLGNTLDAAGNTPEGFSWLGGGIYADTTVAQMETAWQGHLTTRENFETLAAAGFNAVRIPTTWFKALDEELNIREDWMDRVQQVVDWALDAGLMVILNSHHDTGIFRLFDEHMYDSRYYLIRVWQQIAYRFRDYDERLIFNSLNEPRSPGTPAEWTGGTPEERNNLNILNQLFVDVVRASGGNNAYRVLLVPTYAASTSNPAMNGFVLPADTVPDRIAVALHIYSPYGFALQTGDGSGIITHWDPEIASHTNAFATPLNNAHTRFISQGIPVVLSEMGALNRGYEEPRAVWAYHFVSFARSLGMPTFWWDNNSHGISTGSSETFGILHRQTNDWPFPLIIDALMRATE